MLKAIVDKIDDLPETTKTLCGLITEGDHAGKFILNIEPVHGFSLENVEGLKGALGATKSELESSKAAVEGFKGLDAKEVRRIIKEHERLSKIDPETEAGKLAEVKLQAQIDALTAEKASLYDKLLRRQAEFENYRKRVERERAELYQHGRDDVLLQFLPVVDNFERALSSLETSRSRNCSAASCRRPARTLSPCGYSQGGRLQSHLSASASSFFYHCYLSDFR